MSDDNTQHTRQIMASVALFSRHVAICPGSRSTPLALAADAHPDLETRVILDERAAGYWAVGVARATGRPGTVITTSGTAVANLFPAVVEAYQAALPLIALTADRPPRMRNTGANQTIDQRAIFGRYAGEVRLRLPPTDNEAVPFQMAEALENWGPLHLNVPLDEPLLPSDPDAFARQEPVPLQSTAPTQRPCELPRQGRSLIVVGPTRLDRQDGRRIAQAASRFGIPVLADPMSRVPGLGNYDAILSEPPEGLTPDCILQIGAAPVSKNLGRWLLQHDTIRYRIDPTGRRWDEGAPHWLDGDPVRTVEGLRGVQSWNAWQVADGAAGVALAEHGCEEATAVVAVQASLGEEDRLFIGNSLPVRDLDRFGARPDDGPTVHANRGASGIDGNVATAVGLSAAGPVTAIVGDLTFQHDLGSLALLAERDVRVVVIDNGGGGIFRHLPVAASSRFDDLFRTPQGLDLVGIARAAGLRAGRVEADDVVRALERHQVVVVDADGAAGAAARDKACQAAAHAAREALADA